MRERDPGFSRKVPDETRDAKCPGVGSHAERGNEGRVTTLNP